MLRLFIFLIFTSDLKKVIKVDFKGVVQAIHKTTDGPPIENH